MTQPREIMEKLMNGLVPPQRIPYRITIPPAFYERMEEAATVPLSQVYHFDWGYREFIPKMRGKPPLDTPWDTQPDNEQHQNYLNSRFAKYLPKQRPEGLRVSEYGIISVPGSMHHLRKMIHPLANAATVEELENYPFPDMTESWRWEELEKNIKIASDQGCYLIGCLYYIYEAAWYLRGQEQLMIDFYENPEFAHRLFDKIADIQEYVAVRLARLGVDCLTASDDIAHQQGLIMKPEHIRKWILSRWQRVINAAKEINPKIKVNFHTDGKCQDIIPDLMSIGVTAINPVQPECDDPEFLKRKFGKKLVLFGTVSANTLSFGTPDEVRAEVKRRMETAKRYGGMFITPNNCPDINTPYENFKAFLDACQEYGTVE